MTASTASTTTLRRAVFPRVSVLTDAVLVLGGALFVALFAQISIPLPFTPVPITGQTFAVLLVGGALGSLCGVASMSLYMLMGIVGLPVYANQAHGFEIIKGATGGYIVGFLVAGLLVGYLADRGWDQKFSTSGTMMLTGNVIIFLVGLIWLQQVLHTSLADTLKFGLYPFVPGEIVKLYLAAALLPGAWALVRRIRS
jgi:biotin transport system substrate-specific component